MLPLPPWTMSKEANKNNTNRKKQKKKRTQQKQTNTKKTKTKSSRQAQHPAQDVKWESQIQGMPSCDHSSHPGSAVARKGGQVPQAGSPGKGSRGLWLLADHVSAFSNKARPKQLPTGHSQKKLSKQAQGNSSTKCRVLD